jgi:hypothetical protein
VAVTKADVVLIAPELSTVPEDTFAALIDDAAAQMNEGVWGARYELGMKYLVAHLATLTVTKGAPPLQSVTVGPVSRSYAMSVSESASALRSTSYGLEYLRLVQIVAALAVV